MGSLCRWSGVERLHTRRSPKDRAWVPAAPALSGQLPQACLSAGKLLALFSGAQALLSDQLAFLSEGLNLYVSQ